MKKVTRSIFLIALLVIMSATTVTSHAEPENLVKLDYYFFPQLTLKLYVSESNEELGTLIAVARADGSRVKGSTNLKPGKKYYLHAVANDEGQTPYFAGIFNLTGSGMKFSNNSNELKTNPTDFRAYKDGLGKTELKVSYLASSRPTYIDGTKYIIAEGGKDQIIYTTTIFPVESALKAEATGTNSGIDVKWNSITGATSYSVERSTTTGGPYTEIATGLTETSYTDKNVAANTAYYYIVKAKLSDTETVTSSEVSGTPTFDTPTLDSKLKVVLEPEEKLQLSVDDHLDENTNMTWTSSDSTVAQVDANGVVTAIKAGDAVIHVQSPDGSYSDDINILVVDNADDYRLAVDLKVGKTTRLTVDNLTNTLNVAWESSDTTVATVSSKGVVTAKGKGLTLAKATDREGNVVGQVYVRVRD